MVKFFLNFKNLFSSQSKQREFVEWFTMTSLPSRIHFLTVQEAHLSYEVTPVTLPAPSSQCTHPHCAMLWTWAEALLLGSAWLHWHRVCTALKLLAGSKTGSISRSCRSLHSFCCTGQICSALLYPYFGNSSTQICATYYLCPKT